MSFAAKLLLPKVLQGCPDYYKNMAEWPEETQQQIVRDVLMNRQPIVQP